MPRTSNGGSAAHRARTQLRKKINVVSWSKTLEIRQLSNFAPAAMEVALTSAECRLIGLDEDGVSIRCGSVEGFVQALKADSVDEQRRIALLDGKPAKSAGTAQPAHIGPKGRYVFFFGKQIEYCSPAHRALIEYAIWLKFRDDAASQRAMRWTDDAELTHNLGKFDAKPGKTSLPKQVFVRILTECREMVNGLRTSPSFEQIFEAIVHDTRDEAKYYRAEE